MQVTFKADSKIQIPSRTRTDIKLFCSSGKITIIHQAPLPCTYSHTLTENNHQNTNQPHSQILGISLMLLQSLCTSLEKLFPVAWTKITATWYINFLTHSNIYSNFIQTCICFFHFHQVYRYLFTEGCQSSLSTYLSYLPW